MTDDANATAAHIRREIETGIYDYFRKERPKTRLEYAVLVGVWSVCAMLSGVAANQWLQFLRAIGWV